MAETKEGSGGSHAAQWIASLLGGLAVATMIAGMLTGSAWIHDGMAVKRDPGTGCEYLCGFYGLAGCTPRLGPDAKPICKGGR